MKNMKRFLSVIITLCLILTCVPSNVIASEESMTSETIILENMLDDIGDDTAEEEEVILGGQLVEDSVKKTTEADIKEDENEIIEEEAVLVETEEPARPVNDIIYDEIITDGKRLNADNTVIELMVGQSITRGFDGIKLNGELTTATAGIATVTSVGTGDEAKPAVPATKKTSIENGTFLLGNGTRWIVMNADGSITSTTDDSKATIWTINGNNDSFTAVSGNRYLVPNSRLYPESLETSRYLAANWDLRSDRGMCYVIASIPTYIRFENNNWGFNIFPNNTAVFPYTPAEPEVKESRHSDITFTGVSEGETTVVIEGTTYRVIVRDIHYDSNLTVQWVDDTKNAVIKSDNIVLDYTGSVAPTFLTNIVNNGTTGAPAGTINLNDNAYIVNKDNQQVKFEKDLAKLQGISAYYTSGLYNYTSADISRDGKTLTLHYTKDVSKLSQDYVVDFGLPVEIPLSDFGVSATNVGSITFDQNTVSYNNGVITYTPDTVLIGIVEITATVAYKNATDTDTLKINILPATTVYYEEGFATMEGFTGAGKGQGTQKTQKAGQSSDEYGFDAAYVNKSTTSHASSQAKADSATFTFTGTGVDVYAQTTASTGKVTMQLLNADGKNVKLAIVDTKANGTYGDKVSNNAENYKVLSIRGLTHGSYTVKAISSTDTTVVLDGFRVYGTLADEKTNAFYRRDLEEDPSYFEMRNAVLTAIAPDASDSAKTYAQIFEKTDGKIGSAVVLNTSDVTIADDPDELLNNGPKNELYLAKGQELVFKVRTPREVQLGMKAPNGSTSYRISGTNVTAKTGNITSCVDMFYTIASSNSSRRNEMVFRLQNTGDNVLSITDLKVCDCAESPLETLTEEDFVVKEEIPSEPVEDEEPVIDEEPVNFDITLSQYEYAYSGLAKKPTVTVKVDGVKLNSRTDYSVAYKNNVKVGTATVIVTGKGKYEGTAEKTFVINPIAAKLSSVSYTRGKGIVVKWSKEATATGYEVRYATQSSFVNAETVVVGNVSTTQTIIPDVASGRRYYVSIRSFTEVNGVKYYSTWSSSKYVTTSSNILGWLF